MKLSKVGRQLLLLLIGFNICGRIGVLGLPTFFDYPVNSSDTFPRIINSDNILPVPDNHYKVYHDSPPTASDIFVPFSGGPYRHGPGPYRHGPGPYRPGPGSFRYGPDRPSIQDNIPRLSGGPYRSGVNLPPGYITYEEWLKKNGREPSDKLHIVPLAGVNPPPGYITYEEWLKKNGRDPSDKLHFVPYPDSFRDGVSNELTRRNPLKEHINESPWETFEPFEARSIKGPGMLIPIDPVPGVIPPPGYITYEEWLKKNGLEPDYDPVPYIDKPVPFIGPFRSSESIASLTGVPSPYPPELFHYGDNEVEPPVIDEEHQSYAMDFDPQAIDYLYGPPQVPMRPLAIQRAVEAVKEVPFRENEVEPPITKEKYPSLGGYNDNEVEPPVIKDEDQSYVPYPPELVPFKDNEVEPPVIKEEHQSYDSLFDRIRPLPPRLISLPGIPSHVFTNLMWTKIPKHLLPASAEKAPGNYRGGSGLQIRTPGGRDPGSHLPLHDISAFRRQAEQSQPGLQNLYEKNWELATLFN